MADENETKIRDAVGPTGTESPAKSPVDVPATFTGTWAPIDTAPRDGRLIIAALFKGQALKWVKEAGWLSAEDVAEINGDDDAEGYEPSWATLGDSEDPIYPSHWMPMPTGADK